MGRFGLLMIGVAVVVLPGATARAADMPGYPALPLPFPSSEPVPQIQEFISGWYMRGDLAYRFEQVQGASDPTTVYSDESIHNPLVLGVGAGWKYEWFRLDVTADYGWAHKFSGTGSGGTSVTADIEDFTVLGNAYVDFGTWYGFTPYIGGGIGGAYLKMSDYQMTPAASTTTGTSSQWNFAWAAMAGVSFSPGYNWIIDIGYRHIELGDITGGPIGNQLTLDNVTGDEIRIGFRYVLD